MTISQTEDDQRKMRRALDLAQQGVGLTSPNPCVGAVIVSPSGSVVGEGSHTFEGVKHAEVLAIEQAGDKACGATLYVNLEPCSHRGRTGPCSEAVLRAGISRVVAAMQDPNPEVAGTGFEKLRAAGVDVVVGVLELEAKQLNEAFAKYIRHHTPLVTLKSAMTLDGKIAPPPRERESGSQGVGSSVHITGEAARAHVQQLRHANDAILVGVGTVLADDPLLTDRSRLPRRRRLLRVILDSKLRLPLASRLVASAEDDVVVLCTFAEEKKKRQLLQRGIKIEEVPAATTDGRPDMVAMCKHLGSKQITNLLIEGGSTVNGEALRSGIVDKIFFYYSPMILGGSESVSLVSGTGFPGTLEAPRLKSIALRRFGEDFAVEGYFRDPYLD